MEFRVLGAIEVAEGGDIMTVRAPRLRALLARLLVDVNRVVSGDRLLDDLWPEGSVDIGGSVVHITVSRLRRLLGRGGAAIVTRPTGYLLATDDHSYDAVAFEAAVGRGRELLTQGDVAGASSVLADALQLWRGDAFAELSAESWAMTEAARLEELRLSAVEDRIAADLALGRHRELVAELEALTTRHPFAERLWVQRMTALYRAGRQADALRAAADLRRLLAEELHGEPSAEVVELERAIVHQAPDLAWVPPSPLLAPAPTVTAEPVRPPLPPPAAGAGWREPFVGRQAELDRLRGPLAGAAGGGDSARLVVVSGEPGIGKTRLVAEAVDSAHQQGATVLWGRCLDEATASYQPFLEALSRYCRDLSDEMLVEQAGRTLSELARLLPDVARLADQGAAGSSSAGDPETERFRLFEAIAFLLAGAARTRPVFFVIDDLHWADTPTLLLLGHLLRHETTAGVRFLATYRNSEPSMAVERLLSELDRGGALGRVSLAGLDDDAVLALITSVTSGRRRGEAEQLASALRTKTDGNPFFIRELLQSTDPLAEAVPEKVTNLIASRVERLSPAANSLLRAAAVAGEEFEPEVVRVAAGLDVDPFLDALDEAIAARLVAEVPGRSLRYGFGHSLVRASLYEGTSTTRRLRLHQSVGRALERASADEVDRQAGELAHHFGQAALLGDAAAAEKAVRYARRAGQRALDRLAYEEAADDFQQALDVLLRTPAADPRARCDILLELGDALRRIGTLEVARATFQEAAAIAREVGDGGRLAQAAVGGWGGYALSASRPGPVQELFEDALAVLGPDDDPLRVQLLAHLSLHLNAAADRAGDVAAWSAEAVAMADRLGVADLQVLARLARFSASAGPDLPLDEWRDELPRLATLADGCGESLAWAAHALTRSVRLELGDVAGADDDNRRLMALADRLRIGANRAWAKGYEAMRAFLDGQLDDAERLAAEAVPLAMTADPDVAMANYGAIVLVVRWAQGRLDEIEPQAALLVQQYPSYWASACALAMLYAELGRDVEARALFERQGANGFADLPRNDQWMVGMWCLSLTCHLLGDQARAVQLYELVAPHAHRVISLGTATVCLGSMQTPAGALALTTGRVDDAIAHLRAGADHNRLLGARPFLAHTLALLATALVARGGAADLDDAVAALDEALAVAGDGMAGVSGPAAALRSRISPAS